MSARKAGAEAVALFSRESIPPYGRPSLPAVAFSGRDDNPPPLHPVEWYAKNGIELRLDTAVTGIDLENHLLKTLDGEELFDAFVLAGGANPLKPIIPGLMASPSLYTLWSSPHCAQPRPARRPSLSRRARACCVRFSTSQQRRFSASA